MVRLTRLFVVLFAFAAALLLTELVVRYLVRYPAYGVKERAYGMRGSGLSSNLFSPYSAYWTVEGGNKVYRRNNLGLTGVDVKISRGTKYIFVLGDSYIQSYEVPPESISTSFFNRRLAQDSPDWAVLNLGRGGFDPYDLYYRSMFFEKSFPPSGVFLAVGDESIKFFARRKHPLEYDPVVEPRPDTSPLIFIHHLLRNWSALVNLVARATYDNQPLFDQNLEADVDKNRNTVHSTVAVDSVLMNDMFQCIDQFKERYGKRFVLVSFALNKDLNRSIGDYCSSKEVAFAHASINTSRYKLYGSGHFNPEGQRTLGNLLYDSFVLYIAGQSQ